MSGVKAKKPSAASPTMAVPKDDISENPQPVGLLVSELDVFEVIGLGPGATLRAKELVLKGLTLERQEQSKLVAKSLKRKIGRPTKDISINVERAAAVLGASDLFREITGRDCPTQKAAIELAQQIDQILCGADPTRSPLFPNTVTFKTFQDTVSDGLKNFETIAHSFLKK